MAHVLESPKKAF